MKLKTFIKDLITLIPGLHQLSLKDFWYGFLYFFLWLLFGPLILLVAIEEKNKVAIFLFGGVTILGSAFSFLTQSSITSKKVLRSRIWQETLGAPIDTRRIDYEKPIGWGLIWILFFWLILLPFITWWGGVVLWVAVLGLSCFALFTFLFVLFTVHRKHRQARFVLAMSIPTLFFIMGLKMLFLLINPGLFSVTAMFLTFIYIVSPFLPIFCPKQFIWQFWTLGGILPLSPDNKWINSFAPKGRQAKIISFEEYHSLIRRFSLPLSLLIITISIFLKTVSLAFVGLIVGLSFSFVFGVGYFVKPKK